MRDNTVVVEMLASCLVLLAWCALTWAFGMIDPDDPQSNNHDEYLQGGWSGHVDHHGQLLGSRLVRSLAHHGQLAMRRSALGEVERDGTKGTSLLIFLQIEKETGLNFGCAPIAHPTGNRDPEN
jgi:hypothetical protein